MKRCNSARKWQQSWQAAQGFGRIVARVRLLRSAKHLGFAYSELIDNQREIVMSVGSICTRHVFSIDASADAAQAAKAMRDYHVGFLVVTTKKDGHEIPIGVLTDRDIVLEVVAQRIDPQAVAAKDIMTTKPVVVREQAPLHETLLQMRAAGVRRVPVQDAYGKLVGVLSLDDVVGFLNELVQDVAGTIDREQSVETRLRA
jgi:CBS domain-containing protein